MKLSFTKMHGLGNDFVVLNALQTPIQLSREQIRFIADRRFGVGCDQVLMIESTQTRGVDIRYRIFNADGAEVEQCGNGVRCIGDFLRRHSLIEGDAIKVETMNGLVTIYFENDDQIRVDMGVPAFRPQDIPMAVAEQQEFYTLKLGSGDIEIMAVSMSNPHAVLVVDDLEQASVATLGPLIQQHPVFPESVNVGFMQVLDSSHIRLRVYERGVGETLACGTGACGAVAAGINTGKLANDVDVELKGGNLRISWAGDGQHVWMTGPATTVYEGHIEI
ncbi:MAG: diaminopimelate epimerase [Gammaproteobacteria bacterium]|jgi:diaminopimelate epimerase|nr:diaminopimelate epimerase [Gammaproteobacteria bacterium]